MKGSFVSRKSDFSQGQVWKCIVAQAIPLTIAQLVQLLYNVVDRIYLVSAVYLCFPWPGVQRIRNEPAGSWAIPLPCCSAAV